MRRLEGDDQDKLYESLNPMTDEMLSDSDEIIDEGKLIFRSVEKQKIDSHRKHIFVKLIL